MSKALFGSKSKTEQKWIDPNQAPIWKPNEQVQQGLWNTLYTGENNLMGQTVGAIGNTLGSYGQATKTSQVNPITQADINQGKLDLSQYTGKISDLTDINQYTKAQQDAMNYAVENALGSKLVDLTSRGVIQSGENVIAQADIAKGIAAKSAEQYNANVQNVLSAIAKGAVMTSDEYKANVADRNALALEMAKQNASLASAQDTTSAQQLAGLTGLFQQTLQPWQLTWQTMQPQAYTQTTKGSSGLLGSAASAVAGGYGTALGVKL